MTRSREHEAQRRSFAYGNTKLANDAITRATVDQAAAAIDRKAADEAQDEATRLSPGRVVASVIVCTGLMTACAIAAARGWLWFAVGIPLAPLAAAAVLTRTRRA